MRRLSGRGAGAVEKPARREVRACDAVRASRRRALPLPPRPSLPPTLGCALGLWAGCAAALDAAASWGASACRGLAVIGLAAALAFAVALWRRRAAQLWAAALGVALGLACAGSCAAAQHGAQEGIEGAQGSFRFEALADSSVNRFGASCLARADLPGIGKAVVRLRFPEGEGAPRFGEAFVAQASLAAPRPSSAASCWRQGAVAEARVDDFERIGRTDALGALVGVRNRAIAMIGGLGKGEGGAVLAALVCGWREGLAQSDAYEAYKSSGLAHLVAVSGAHLSIVAGCSAALLRALRLPRRLSLALQAALVLGYLVLAAAPPSALRAALMALAGMLSFTARRRPAALASLSLCMISCIALSPLTALSISFALSALSTLGIVVFAGLCEAWIAELSGRLPRLVREALALFFASSLLSMPLAAALFSQLSLAAPLANVLAAPFFPLVCSLGLIAVVVGLLAAPLAPPLLGAATGAAGALTELVRLIAGLPFASVAVCVPLQLALLLSLAAASALWLFWPRPRKKAVVALSAAGACLALVAFVAIPRLAGDEIIMLDVGQGDAFVLRSQGSAVLIDTGNHDQLLREGLARHGIYRLDAVIVTHGDDDHMGSLASLKGVVAVDRVLVAADALRCPCDSCKTLLADARLAAGERVEGLHAGDSLSLGAFDLKVVWPKRFTDEGGNADSVCILADADEDGDGQPDWRALFTGDAERDQLRALIDSGAVGPVDVYKVGHHGSRNALDEREASELEPRIALVSVGANNRYGHPTAETLARLDGVGAQIFRSDESGDVSCKLKPDRIEVETLR